jgi:prevent-host-death family protein
MAASEPITQTIDVAEAAPRWDQLVEAVVRRRARVIVEKSGKPVAAIIPARDLERFNRWEAEREKDFAILEEIREAFKDVPAEEIEREVAKALAEVREEDRLRAQSTQRT